MKHPLTNEDCLQIIRDVADYWDHEKNPSTPMAYELMRAAYDLAIEHVKNEIELQLEPLAGEWRLDKYDTSIAIEDFGKELIKTIRPQEDK